MTTVLVAVLLVLLVCRGVPDIARLRNFSWWQAWLDRLGTSSPASALMLGVGLPVLVCALVQWGLHGILYGLGAFVFAAAVLFYCWGPRDLEIDAEAVAKAPDSERRTALAQMLRPDGQNAPLPFEAQALVAATFGCALKRWFGVLLWFAVFGPAGALFYRLTQLFAFAPGAAERPVSVQDAARRLAAILDWAPAHLMALALALGSNFDAVFKTWRDWHAAHKGQFDLDPGFLDAIARASVDADVAAIDDETQDAHAPLVALDDAMVLVRRVLVVWLTVIALIVLAGWFG
jgi:AmpE protein